MAFDNGPHASVCAEWPTPPRHETWSPTPGPGAPLLVITGSYDPFIDPTHVRRTLSVYRELTFVNIPWAGHNVLGEVQCAIDLRNRWLDDPRATRRCTAG
jgi:pimeloyl-ACP methyl ester carboxylesterase